MILTVTNQDMSQYTSSHSLISLTNSDIPPHHVLLSAVCQPCCISVSSVSMEDSVCMCQLPDNNHISNHDQMSPLGRYWTKLRRRMLCFSDSERTLKTKFAFKILIVNILLKPANIGYEMICTVRPFSDHLVMLNNSEDTSIIGCFYFVFFHFSHLRFLA